MNFASKLAERKAITLEWNFFTTSHDKDVVDGIGGTLKKVTDTLSLRQKAVPTGMNITDANSFIRSCQDSTFIKLLEYGTTEWTRWSWCTRKWMKMLYPYLAFRRGTTSGLLAAG